MAERSVPQRRALLSRLGLLLAVVAGTCVQGLGGPLHGAALADAAPTRGPNAPEIAIPLPGLLLQTFGSEALPHLLLEIKPKHLAKLKAKRDEALERKRLDSSSDDEVPGTLRYGDLEARVRIRPEASSLQQLRGNDWSYRVTVRGGQSVLGMRRFSLEVPERRSQRAEPLFLDFLRTQGVLAPRHFFVDLSVNGKSAERRALEEHFSTELLEHQHRRDGVILRFDEKALRAGEAAFMGDAPDYDNWRNTPLDAFRDKKISESPLLSAQRGVGMGLLRGLAEGSVTASQALDIDGWARFLAACELWSTPRLTDWNQLRMYLNPFTLRLEPIGFDGSGAASDAPGLHCSGGDHSMMASLLGDPQLRGAFLERLHETARYVGSADFAAWLAEREAEYLPRLKDELPWLKPVSLVRMRKRAAELLRIDADNFEMSLPPAPLRRMSHEAGASYPTLVRASVQSDAATLSIELANAISKPVVVTALYAERKGERRAIPGTPLTLSPTPWPDAPKRIRVPLKLAGVDPAKWRIRGEARLDGRVHPFEIKPGVAALEAAALPESSLEEALMRHPFLTLADATDTPVPWLVAKPGVHDVAGSLVLPSGYGLRIGPGTTLRFSPGQLLLARGPLDFVGSADQPIRLESSGARFSGIAHLGSPHPSRWKHVAVRRTEAASGHAWQLTGAVTFRRTRLLLEHCSFEDSVAEDSLNTVRSEVTLREVSVRKSPSDAVDLDFCVGRIEGGSVSEVGGDGLDAAGSELEIENVSLFSIADKAISIGEASQVKIDGVTAKHCGSGVASKDGSRAIVQNSSFDGVRVAGLMAYTKKPAYGPAQLDANRVTITGDGRKAIAQLGSRITIDGVRVASEPLDVDALYDAEASAP